MKQRILMIVEDDPGLQKQMRWCLDEYEVVLADTRERAIAQLRRNMPAVVTLDLGLPPDPDGASEGLATLQEILTLAPQTKVIIVSGNQERAFAVRAIGLGAYDFYQKPFEPETLKLVITRAFHVHELHQENLRLQQHSVDSPLQGLITRDPALLKICRTIEKVAPSNASVMLLGDTGTGKEIMAQGLHQLSPRAKQRFVAINCAAIPDQLLESELFGYEKGAFTSAVKQTPGKIELADGGTLFLDEVGDLPPALQAKLLRFLQQRVIERVGGREEIPVDVRLVCATHLDLKELIAGGRFREDFYYRLSEIEIRIPPLRHREGDVVLLAHLFLKKFSVAEGRKLSGFQKDALDAIDSYSWPGNVRELENCMRRAVIMAAGPRISLEDIGLPSANGIQESLNLRQVREQTERLAVSKALARTEGNIVKAAELLGVSRPTLYDLINRYRLSPGDKHRS